MGFAPAEFRLGLFAFFDLEIHPDPIQQTSVRRANRFGSAKKPAVLSFHIGNSEAHLGGGACAQAGGPDPTCLFGVVGMEKRNVGIPRSAAFQAEPERVIFRETQIVRTPSIHESETTGGSSAPGVRRNQI
jgi:hypothetical protein